MGLFGNLARGAGRLAGKAVSAFGEAIGSERIERAGDWIQDKCRETSRKTGETDRYDKERARADETRKINMILTEFSLKTEERADEIEQTCIKECEVYFDELIFQLENSSTESGINIKNIQRNISVVRREIRGNLKAYIAKRISIDDQKCLEVLKLEAGEVKTNAMERFTDDVIKTGLNNVIKDIKKILKNQKELLNEVVEEKLEDIKFNLEQKLKAFDEIENNMNSDSDKLILIQNVAETKISLSDACINCL